ncbi:hypothetical protein [Microbulbifer thermotolerans]|uniref:Uncharacterized protein n=1 Tax=Microbulbifer thermotolerans TaxID=252514 RepID=A0A143HNJ2_MICTH|nr:hypothetical protein [Microbulbifer thermotolerans]AMX03305.1 hypothetical protein A3224_12590 [Microbulbifer thermotolerans]MCX2794396.1 hypothetical protein [Microbulbifer thermotolerans]
MALIPDSYREWRHCITVICAQKLTPVFIDSRLRALQDDSDYMTKRFVQLYGEEQRRRTLAWFARAKEELGNPRQSDQ